jgi:hypothetical protein
MSYVDWKTILGIPEKDHSAREVYCSVELERTELSSVSYCPRLHILIRRDRREKK